MLFQKVIPVTPTPQITPTQAQEVYSFLKSFGGPSQAFSGANKYPFEYFVDVRNEIQALEEVATEEMMSDDIPKNKSDLISRLDSDVLDLDVFTTDFMDYIMTYKEGTTRDDFVSQFIFLKSQND